MGGDIARRVDLGEGCILVLNLIEPVRPGMCAIVYPLAVQVRGRAIDVPRAECLSLHPDARHAEQECVRRIFDCLKVLLSDDPSSTGPERTRC